MLIVIYVYGIQSDIILILLRGQFFCRNDCSNYLILKLLVVYKLIITVFMPSDGSFISVKKYFEMFYTYIYFMSQELFING